MAVVVNNPSQTESGNNNFLIGLILAIVLIALFVIYVLPRIGYGGFLGGTQVNIPDRVNVNVQGGGGGQPAN